MISVDGRLFDPESEYISLGLYHRSGDVRKLAAKLREFVNLLSASFRDSDLDDVGLRYLSEIPTIEALDLQGTKISNEGLSVLERLPNLKHLRLKDNDQLSNDCVPHLLKIKQLTDLQIHETSIDQYGLNQLVAMVTLTGICLYVCDGNYSFDGLLNLSIRMPRCRILAKGRGEFCQGDFDGTWTK